MKPVKAMVSIHNKFDILVKDAKTNEVIQRGQAENIVLDTIYTRLLNYNTYFVNICLGGGTGTPSTDRTTLFNYIGYKAASTEELIGAYPTSKWVRKIRLGTEEYNGNTITEVGISHTYPGVNTHALIKDAEGAPLSVEKTNLRIIDIYATVFIDIYGVDTGLYWYGSGLREYLTGGSVPANTLGISNLEQANIATITGTKTTDATNKTITVSGRFNVDALNKDVRFLYWTGVGLGCEVPRPNLYEGTQINNKTIGIGDSVTTKFNLGRTPNTPIENLSVLVDGAAAGFTHNIDNTVTLAIAPAVDSVVTVSYKSLYIPKDSDHVLDVSFQIGFGLGQPTPVVAPPVYDAVPGSVIPIAGDETYGFFGEVHPDALLNGVMLAKELGLTAGTIQNTDAPWLKFALDGKTLFVAKKTLRHTIPWNSINAVNAVYGDKIISVKGFNYRVRLMKTGTTDPMVSYNGTCNHGSEWNRIMLPIHIEAKDKTWAFPANVEADIPYWGIDYTDEDLLTHYNHGTGSYSWCQETYSSNRVFRGSSGVSYSNNSSPSYSAGSSGWRPVLELVA
ncbi:MAG: hypothetical protein PHX79_05850 [Sphaerochaetaceae bacterium]|nr:hypothetical protein [Sphaerochaetaceae bacterium]